MVKAKNLFIRAISFVFLAGYLANIVSFESFHQVVHHHHHDELHSSEAEADACHRAIYHGEVSDECEHKSHITESEIDCELCDVVTSRSSDYLSTTQEESTYFSSSCKYTALNARAALEPNFRQAYLRGPPLS